jgi:hypothetical protein
MAAAIGTPHEVVAAVHSGNDQLPASQPESNIAGRGPAEIHSDRTLRHSSSAEADVGQCRRVAPRGSHTHMFLGEKKLIPVKRTGAQYWLEPERSTKPRVQVTRAPPVSKVSNSGRNSQWDNQDRMFDPAEFSKLQRMVGVQFTLDACCNSDGSNAHVPACFKSPEDSFLDYDCSGHSVWLNPPFADITPFLRHYSECKAKSPHNTSAVIVLPRWKGSHSQYLRGMQVIKEYPKGSCLFTGAPKADSTDREPLGPVPWAVQVFYDPPVAVPLACSATADQAFSATAESLGGPPESGVFNCVHLQGRIAGANARCLVDSGASQSVLSARFCKTNGVIVTPAPQVVELADGQSMQVTGVCNVRLQIGSFRSVHKCWVAALHPAYDLILGRTWMSLHRAILARREPQHALGSDGQGSFNPFAPSAALGGH